MRNLDEPKPHMVPDESEPQRRVSRVVVKPLGMGPVHGRHVVDVQTERQPRSKTELEQKNTDAEQSTQSVDSSNCFGVTRRKRTQPRESRAEDERRLALADAVP